MAYLNFPVIDLEATGRNIVRIRRERGLTVRDLQRYFGFEEPRAIYKWQRGENLPSIDNLYALSRILQVPMDSILVPRQLNILTSERQNVVSCRSVFSPAA